MSDRPSPEEEIVANQTTLVNLEKMAEPGHRVLAALTQGCSENPNARTVAVTTLVISLWQCAGRGMAHGLPSLILLNATGNVPDPINDFAARLVSDKDAIEVGVQSERAFARWDPRHAPVMMANAILEKGKLGTPTPQNLHQHQKIEECYFAAQEVGFGTTRTRPYAEAWHETFDLLTDQNDQITLRLKSEEDCTVFRKHQLKETKKILIPTGYGAGLVRVVKRVTLSGSMRPEQWDAKLATKMVDLGLPYFFLPHTCAIPPIANNLLALDHLTQLLPGAFHTPLEEPANFLPDEWSENYGKRLRERLRELPGTYEYALQRMARQLFPVCSRLAICSDPYSTATAAEIEALTLDLYGHTLRGLVIGVAGLAWHGLGFDTGIPRAQALNALKHLRTKGPMTKSDLMRVAHLTKDQRDLLLDRLVAEDLVRVDETMITASTYKEFVDCLYSRKEFPVPENHLENLAKAAASEA